MAVTGTSVGGATVESVKSGRVENKSGKVGGKRWLLGGRKVVVL